MKKVLATILALVMALGLTATAWAAQPTPPAVAEMGVTTYNDLHTALEAAKNGGTVKLLGDVNLTTSDWTPVGTSSEPFKGTFDGDGHKITGLKITSGSYIGLFGYVGEGATIKNVNLVGANVFGVKRVGALIGQIKGNATVSNCTVDSISHVTGSDSNTGGLIGEAAGGITVKLEKLINYATVTNTENNGTSRAAGIIAQVTSGANVTITKCVNNGAITTNNGYAGGIVAAKQGGSKVLFENCSNAGTLTGNYTGSLIAWLVGGNWLSMTNSGDARTAIGAVNICRDNQAYTFYFTIDGEEYYLRKLGATEDSDARFSELWDRKQTINRAYMNRIIDFFAYAKEQNSNFANYPFKRAELFAHAWNTSDHTKMDNMFGAEGWRELLVGYNAGKEYNMTSDDFKVIWDEDILYSAPAPAPTPDPTPSTGGYYYYPSTTTNDTTKGSPKTFDAGVGIYAVTAVLSVTGMAWAAKKRGN
mgnify:CR=1 FL=1